LNSLTLPWLRAGRLFVFPDLKLVVVITAGNYNRTDQAVEPINLIEVIE
jgi:hypothetical protein